jgi:hypothetical protein
LTTNRAKLLLRPKLLVPLVSLTAGSLLAVHLAPQSVASNQATAASTCTLTVPTKIAIGGNWDMPTMQIGNDCKTARVTEAKWEAKAPSGTVLYKTFFRFGHPEQFHLFATSALCVWTWHPAGALGAGDITLKQNNTTTPSGGTEAQSQQAAVALTQNTPTTDVRMFGEVNLELFKYDTYWDLAVYGDRYAITPGGMINWGGAPGSIQYRPIGGTNWTVLQSFTTNSTGDFDLRITKPAVQREYRSHFSPNSANRSSAACSLGAV